MKKALIFIASFMVSTMVIYSVYYYSKIKHLKGGVVASADDLPNTVVGQNKEAEGKNFITSSGMLMAASKLNTSISRVPDNMHISLSSTLNPGVIENLNRALVRRFPNHPPLGFADIREGGKVLFSYFFKNIELPANFKETNQSIDFAGEKIDALAITGGYDSTIAFYKNDSLQSRALRITLSDSLELIYFSKPAEDTLGLSATMMDSLQIKLSKQEYLLVPEIDFFIMKVYDKGKYPGYEHSEERYKLKTSVIKENQLNDTSKNSGLKVFEFAAPTYFMMKRVHEEKPYFYMKIVNPEILLRSRKENQ